MFRVPNTARPARVLSLLMLRHPGPVIRQCQSRLFRGSLFDAAADSSTFNSPRPAASRAIGFTVIILPLFGAVDPRAPARSIAIGPKYDQRAAWGELLWQVGRCRLTLWGKLLWVSYAFNYLAWARWCYLLQLLRLSGSRLAWVHDDRDGGQTCHYRKNCSVHVTPSHGLKSRSRAARTLLGASMAAPTRTTTTPTTTRFSITKPSHPMGTLTHV